MIFQLYIYIAKINDKAYYVPNYTDELIAKEVLYHYATHRPLI